MELTASIENVNRNFLRGRRLAQSINYQIPHCGSRWDYERIP
jgi:hypothetical protein